MSVHRIVQMHSPKLFDANMCAHLNGPSATLVETWIREQLGGELKPFVQVDIDQDSPILTCVFTLARFTYADGTHDQAHEYQTQRIVCTRPFPHVTFDWWE